MPIGISDRSSGTERFLAGSLIPLVGGHYVVGVLYLWDPEILDAMRPFSGLATATVQTFGFLIALASLGLTGWKFETEVPREIAQTWVSMCPAQVYEIPEDQLESDAPIVDVHVTASNCVQCGAITAKGGRLTLPEGGDGPLYTET